MNVDSGLKRRSRQVCFLLGMVLPIGALAGWIVPRYPVLSIMVALGWFGISVTLYKVAVIGLSDTRSLVGAFILLTMLRPFPAALGDPAFVGRVVDAAWLLLGILILFLSVCEDGRWPVLWPSAYWLVVAGFSTTLSLVLGPLLFGSTVVLRDFFELYRVPYYLLVLLIGSRVRWTDEQLAKHFFRPILIGIWLVFGVSVLQGMGGQARSIVAYVYTPKYSGQIRFAMGERVRNSGTFGNPNFYAVVLAILIPFLLAAYSATNRRRLRVGAGLGVILAFVFLLMTGSRTGWAAASVSLISYVFWGVRRRSRKYYSRIRAELKKRTATIVIVVAVTVILVGPRLSRVTRTVREIKTGGILQVASFEKKYTLARQFVLRTLKESPIVGFGPSKSVDAYLGDNQYSKLVYRYGIVGVVCWSGFWISIYVAALRMRKNASSMTRLALAHALLSVVPAFLIACIGGDFFDATQIATLLLLLVGVTYGSRGDVFRQRT